MGAHRSPYANQAFVSGLLLGVSLAAMGVLITQALVGPILSRSLESTEEQILGDVHARLADDYVIPPDRAALMRDGVRGMIGALGDDYSTFVGPEELRAYSEDSSGRLIGIGVQLTQGNRVRHPIPDGPAEQAGLLPGDTILAVDGTATTGLDTAGVAALIKGPLRTAVHLQVARHASDEVVAMDILRQSVPTGTVGRIEMVDAEHGIGRIHIRSFAKSTVAELDAALDELLAQGMRALILDLRFNRGGLLDAAVDCAGRFVRGGVICTLEGRSHERRLRKADPKDYRDLDLPVAVLINRHAASGSEVLAAGLRDRGAAIVVGERSYGKGVYQQVQRYQDGEFVIKFTAGYYVTPSGRIIEGSLHPDYAGGIEPDLPVPPGQPDEALLAFALGQDPIPERYREAVVAIWESLRDWPLQLDDPALDTAAAALRDALSPAS